MPNEFVFDDLGLIAKSRSIRDLWNIPTLLGLHGDVAYRPLRTVSHAIDYSLFGLNPAGYRTVNIALHIFNSALVFSLFRTLLRNPRPALLAAILFAVHPVQTESVAYISGRRDLLFSLFYLLGFTWYIRYRETDRPRYLVLTGVGYLLSLLSKEMGITLPVLCVCYDVIRSMPAEGVTGSATSWRALAEGARAAIRHNGRLYAVAAGGLLSLVVYYVFLANPSQQREMYGGGVWPTLLTSARIFAHYLKLLVFPLTLNADYSYNAFPISYSITEAKVILAVIILGGTWWGLYRLLSLDRWAAFGGLWFFVTLLPVSQIVPHHEIAAEHYLYLPSAGVFLMGGALLERILTPQRRQIAIVAALPSSSYCSVSVLRSEIVIGGTARRFGPRRFTPPRSRPEPTPTSGRSPFARAASSKPMRNSAQHLRSNRTMPSITTTLRSSCFGMDDSTKPSGTCVHRFRCGRTTRRRMSILG